MIIFSYFSGLEKNKPSSSKDLDVTLICAIIQNSNYIENPKKGWGREPDKNDIGIADDLERIRQYRNFVCHNTSFKIDTDDFNKAVLDIIWVICNCTLCLQYIIFKSN